MIAMQNTARRPPRDEVDNLRQPIALVHLWWLLLGCFTLLIVLAPGLRVTFHHEALSFTLETFNALVATMVGFVGLARYVFERRPFDLAIAVAFGTIAVTALWFGLILPFTGYTYQSVADAPLWGWILDPPRGRRAAVAGPRRLGTWPQASVRIRRTSRVHRSGDGHGRCCALVLERVTTALVGCPGLGDLRSAGADNDVVLAGQTRSACSSKHCWRRSTSGLPTA